MTGRKTQTGDFGQRPGRQALIWGLALAAAAAWPVILFAYPAAQDAPNHLARAFILLHPDDPLLNRHFEIAWHAQPDLIWDGFAVLAGRLIDLIAALKIFMILGLLLPVFGIALINRQVAGKWTFMPLLGIPFLFHSGYAKGFLGFNVSIGLCLIAIAVWRTFGERVWLRRLVLAWFISTALFFAHLVAWGIYGITVLGLRLSELRSEWRAHGPDALGPWTLRLLRDGTQALPPLAILALAGTLSGHHYSLVGEIAEFHPPWRRIIEAWHLIDVGTYLPSLLVLALVAPLLFYLLFWRRALRFDLTFAVPIGLLVAVFFLVPNQIFATHYVVWRIALGATFLALASGIPTVSIAAPTARWALGVILVATLALSGWQAYSITNASAERAEFEALIARIPAGDTLFATHAGMESDELEFDRIGLYHFAADAVRERKIMVQSLFANPAQQPIRYRQLEFDNPRDNGRVFIGDLAENLADQGISLAAHIARFEWVVIHGPTPNSDAVEVPLEGFAPVGERGLFRLYCRSGSRIDPKNGQSEKICPDGRAP